jgi:hypothetical protein
MFIKEVSSDYFGACGLWTACVVVFKGNFYWKKTKFLCLSSVRVQVVIIIFFLNVNNVCGLYIMTCKDS